ncbi:iron reductase [Lentinula edodes]|uniref:Iron reductase n=1 Tax=Lentinula edodes TaxID=5353 RepID=A0A1Q3ENW8_LENED|nr:iron reductase [Lentinula edodes]
MMFASFVTGGLTNFGSLLSFQNSNLCAFLVTWSILSLDTARLMGLCMLLLALKHLGMKQWELVISLIWLLTGLAFVFINAALATGVTQTIPGPQLGISFCFPITRHIFPTSAVVSTSIYLCLEIFVVHWCHWGIAHDADDRQLINIQDSPDVSPASALTSSSPASTQKDALFSVPAYSWDDCAQYTRSCNPPGEDREAFELAPPKTAVKSLRPKLVIVTKTFDPWFSRRVAWQAEEDELSSVFEHRSFAAPSERILASRFSSPSLATTRSRSTITYPSQIPSSSSASRSSEGLIMVDSASGSW